MPECILTIEGREYPLSEPSVAEVLRVEQVMLRSADLTPLALTTELVHVVAVELNRDIKKRYPSIHSFRRALKSPGDVSQLDQVFEVLLKPWMDELYGVSDDDQAESEAVQETVDPEDTPPFPE